MTRRELARAMLALAALAACSRKTAPPVAGPARRIVSLGPAMTEAVFAIGAGDLAVGRSRYCDWPPEAGRLPAVGGIEPDLEAVLQLAPDLVVGPPGLWSAHVTETLGARGIATWFPPTDSLASVDALIAGLGARTGHATEARALIDRLDAAERSIERAVAGEPRPRVLMVAGLAPVVAAGPATFADETIRRAGGANVVTEGAAWPTLGFERIVELDPDVVLDVSVAETGDRTLITPGAQGWSGVRAVREGRVVPLGDERILRPGPRIAEGLGVLAHALHPQAVLL
ncbi:MAG TPA: helical backbone metal receptor [Polyangiaceae bacterium]|jgi:iron complex transport system substrate-binding protein